MGRSSTTGLPFLVGRQDAGNFTYHRKLPEDLGSMVAGRIDLPWTLTRRDLTGAPTVKISLKTGDLKTARDRWAVVHPQVEALVRIGEVRLQMKRGGDPSSPLPVGTLGTDDIRRLAGQVRHDVLAADDATWDPGYSSPLGDIIAELSARSGARLRRSDAERAAQTVLARSAAATMATRDLAALDRSTGEGDLDVPDAVIADIVRAGAMAVPGRLPDETTAILLGAVTRRDAIPSDVEALLNENGITLPRDHPDRRALALAMLRAKVEAYRIVEARLGGAPDETPERPARLETAPVENGKPLSEMRTRWIGLYKPGTKAIDDNGLYVGRFIEMFGDLPVTAITRKMVRTYRDALEKSARDMPREVRAMTFREQLAWAEARPKVPRLSPQTVNRKGVGSISACMRAAMADDVVSANPCSNLDLKVTVQDKVRRLPYSLEDLVKIFETPVYTAEQRRWVAGGGEAAFWMPIIALYAGARLEEIGQLLCADIRQDDGIDYFDFIDLSDDVAADGHVKRLKTENARRNVPVHPELVALGFMRYVAAMRAKGAKRLFPDLKSYRGRLTHNWSKWWARHTDIHVTKNPSKVFHSFRHKFIDRWKNQMLDRTVLKAVVGHSSGDVTDKYGESVALSTRYGEICRLTYPGLDMALVRGNYRFG